MDADEKSIYNDLGQLYSAIVQIDVLGLVAACAALGESVSICVHPWSKPSPVLRAIVSLWL